MSDLEQTLSAAALAAGELIEQRFRTRFTIDHKDGINNLVTEVDKQAEQLIRTMIAKAFPGHGIIGEEYEIKETDSRYKWVIDPIDGTTNFAHGIPICCVSIGLLDGDDTIMGAVYNPMLQEFFFARKGGGAYLNDVPIRVSGNTDFARAFVVTGFPYQLPRSDKDVTRAFRRLVSLGLPVRRLGAAAIDLCWVACGRFDGFWESGLQPWDVAAGYLILQEAGGKISDFQGAATDIWSGETLATNGAIHDELKAVINS